MSQESASLEPSCLALERSGELARRAERLNEMLSRCELCERRCEMNRREGEMGVCHADHRLKVSSAHLHRGEEAPLRGSRGSGTIFFSHCNLRCCFCLNWQIAHRGDGEHITTERLASLMLRLQEQGAHNINLVTPTQYVPQIIAALRIAIERGLRLPIVYNTSSYENIEVVRLLDGVVDIYLPDFKFQDSERASRYSARAANYPQIAAANILEMHRQVGDLVMDAAGVAQRGVLLRHLVMPDNASGTDRFVQWVANELSPRTYTNIMGQWTPMYRAHEYPEINRRVTPAEYEQALRWAREAGLTRLA